MGIQGGRAPGGEGKSMWRKDLAQTFVPVSGDELSVQASCTETKPDKTARSTLTIACADSRMSSSQGAGSSQSSAPQLPLEGQKELCEGEGGRGGALAGLQISAAELTSLLLSLSIIAARFQIFTLFWRCDSYIFLWLKLLDVHQHLCPFLLGTCH